MDRDDEPGQYLLPGSQNLSILGNIAESLAGRIGILQLEGMTLSELKNAGTMTPWLETFLTDPLEFARRAISTGAYPDRSHHTLN